MSTVYIKLCGCDDTTEFEIDADSHEFIFLKEVAAASEKASTYGCMPILKVSDTKSPE